MEQRPADERMAEFERAAERAAEHRDAVLQGALRWFAAREHGSGKVIAAIEREQPALARRLRALEGELALMGNTTERARTYRRLHDALLVLRMTDVLGEVIDEACPLCALEHGDPH